MITPCRKCKVRYEDEEGALYIAQTLAQGKAGLSLREPFESENEYIILPSEESTDFEIKDRVSTMWAQWSQVLSTVQRLTAGREPLHPKVQWWQVLRRLRQRWELWRKL